MNEQDGWSDDRGAGQGTRVHPAMAVAAGRRSRLAHTQQAASDRQLHTLDRLAERGTRNLGSVYYRASCPACGEPAVWRDQAVGQLPGLGVVRSTSEVVCCVACDGVAAAEAWRSSVIR